MYTSESFEAFLRDCMDHGHTQVKLVPRIAADGSVMFYACGQCGPTSTETFDGSVSGDAIGGPEEVVEVYATVDEDDLALSEASVADVGEVLAGDKSWD